MPFIKKQTDLWLQCGLLKSSWPLTSMPFIKTTTDLWLQCHSWKIKLTSDFNAVHENVDPVLPSALRGEVNLVLPAGIPADVRRDFCPCVVDLHHHLAFTCLCSIRWSTQVPMTTRGCSCMLLEICCMLRICSNTLLQNVFQFSHFANSLVNRQLFRWSQSNA